MTEHLLTPSKITAWLDCAHYLTLKHQVEGESRPRAKQPFGSFAQLLMDKGLEHESAVLAAYEADGLRVLSVEDKPKGEAFADWAQRVAPALESDADVIFQMPFVHEGVRGVADFLERRVDDESGEVSWEPVDAKLARAAAKPGHVLQLCFYAEALAALTGTPPEELQVSLGSGIIDVVGYEAVRPYWDRLRGQLRDVMAAEADETATRPEPCDHCEFCEFQHTCEAAWRDADSLVYVAGIRTSERTALETAGIETLAALATCSDPVDEVREERLERLRVQAQLQLQARNAPDDKPPFIAIDPGDDPIWGHGFEQLPEPDPADIFLDFEGHPFWRPDRGLFFLFGYIATDDEGQWGYHEMWAHDEENERDRVKELIAFIEERRDANPGMHVYHYNHTERSQLESLTAVFAVSEAALANLVDAGVFVDLLVVARNAVQVGVESYGLKHLEQLTSYERQHEIDQGAGAVVAYDRYTHDGDQTHLDSIALYNEDDVRATRALRDWLVDQRPDDLEWRTTTSDVEEEPAEIDELLEALSVFDEGSVEQLLADLLGYWIREWRAYIAPVIGTLTNDTDRHLDNLDVLGGLGNPEEIPLLTPTGRAAKWPGLRLHFPAQELGRSFTDEKLKSVMFITNEGLLEFAGVNSIDIDSGTIDLSWNEELQALGSIPGAVVKDDWVSQKSKRNALIRFVQQVLDPETHGVPNPVTMALLRADAPAFGERGGPPDGLFSYDVEDLCTWVTQLDHGVLGVQGPPGTGKTYRGAHMAKTLVAAGKRVGIMAMSHDAIDNFLEQISETFAEDPAVELRASRNRKEPDSGGLPGVTYVSTNPALAGDEFNVVCGTSWQFAGKDLLASPVDVLLIDEAGQLALIDAVVGSLSATNVVLLGDPQQLPQVAQATHHGGSGASALGHLLGDHETMPDTRGVFIEETRRMHPDVCRFISERIYDGRLASDPGCASQCTELGTGLRWLQVNHSGCSTESIEEAKAISAQIKNLIGRRWTDRDGKESQLGTDDIIVVAPYNDQVRLVQSHLDADPATRFVQVGTVDRFQGRQAPVVFFTMTSSSSQDMPRGPEFLFSTNRLNVAISRAQCLAYLLCTEELLNSRAGTVDDMALIATLCSFVEYAER